MTGTILDSWKAVSQYLHFSVRTCQRLEREAGLPIHRIDDTPKARIYANTGEIDHWLEKSKHHRRLAWPARRALRLAVAAGATVLVLAAGLAVRAVFFPPRAVPATRPAAGGPEAGASASVLEAARAAERAYTSDCEPKHLELAIGLYRQAIADDPASAPAFFGLGHCLQCDYLYHGADPKVFESMRAAYEEAFRLAPGDPQAQVGMGWSRLLAGRRDEAAAWFLKARDLAPASPEVNYHVGCFLGHIGLPGKAVHYLDRAVDLGDRSTRAYRQRAFNRAQACRFPAAAEDAARLCEMNPTNAKMFASHARVLVLLGDLPGAERRLEIGEVLAPRDPDVRLTRAMLWAARGEAAKALEAAAGFRREAKAGPGPSLAAVYALLGLAEDAVADIRASNDRSRARFQRISYPYSALSDPRLVIVDRIRSHPAFRRLLEELRAEEADLLRRYDGF